MTFISLFGRCFLKIKQTMKTEIPQWILDCIDNRNPGRCAEAVEELLAIIEFLRSGKPDWKDAPEWANYLAQDADGTWWWYESQPSPISDGWSPGFSRPYKPYDPPRLNNWSSTMEKRPADEKE